MSISVVLVEGLGKSNGPVTVLRHSTHLLLVALLKYDAKPEVETILVSPRNPGWFGVGMRWHKIPNLSYAQYSNFIIQELADVVRTDHVLIVQEDGYPTNPSAWTPEFLEYDYIGAPWPVELVRKPLPERVGNGGFSLRSRKLLEIGRTIEVDGSVEDFALCVKNRKYLEEQGIRFAPFELAARFSCECTLPERTWSEDECFGFHGWAGNRKGKWLLY